MKIALDLQSLQTTGSRHRGIGRYSLSLAKNMLSEGKQHEFYIVINGNFSDTVEEIKKIFENYLPPENLFVFQTPSPVAEIDPDNQWRCRTAEYIRECFLKQIKPDWVYISSLFEGFVDDAVTSIDSFCNLTTAVTLYDLIPYRYKNRYLDNPSVRSWYLNKVNHLKKAQLILAISQFSRNEAIEFLRIPEERVMSISTDADESFYVREYNPEIIQTLYERYGIAHEYIMYTGGIDYRKNIEGLIKAYAGLPGKIRENHQLVLCCKVLEDERIQIEALASRVGLSRNELLLTGFVSDEDLIALYNCCKLFIFPSIAEGFGLPVLEAMRCGAPVIGSDTTSIPEVIGIKEALFNPMSIDSIREKLYQTLIDDQFRLHLREHGLIQSKSFSWKKTAKTALDAMEYLSEQKRLNFHNNSNIIVMDKPKMAYFSPLPPEKSGISDYSTELLPELEKYYHIDLITDLKEISSIKLNGFSRRTIREFEMNASKYDRILYHIGNSVFHSQMLHLLPRFPGTVVLHDFFLSGVLGHLERTIPGSTVFRQALYRSHGYNALQDYTEDYDRTISSYPCCLDVLLAAKGIIVHSDYSINLAKRFFSVQPDGYMIKIPHLRKVSDTIDRNISRSILKIPENVFLVCSFGFIAPTKLNDRLLDVWLTSEILRNNKCRLVFVGDGQASQYEKMLLEKIHLAGLDGQISITGYVDSEIYHHYLSAADVGVQLRTLSRGETSGAVLDCMAFGLPTIVNNHGSQAEFPSDAGIKLADEFSNDELSKALERLYLDSNRRQTLGKSAKDYIRNNLNPPDIAKLYTEAIEYFNDHHPLSVRSRLITAIVNIPRKSISVENDFLNTALAISENIMPCSTIHQFLIDISSLVNNKKFKSNLINATFLKQLLLNASQGFRIEPVYYLNGIYRYARGYTSKLFDEGEIGLPDSAVYVNRGDVFLALGYASGTNDINRTWLQRHIQRGIETYAIVCDLLPILKPKEFLEEGNAFKDWLHDFCILSHGIICASKMVVNELGCWLEQNPVKRERPLKIGSLNLVRRKQFGKDEMVRLINIIFKSIWTASWDEKEGFHWDKDSI